MTRGTAAGLAIIVMCAGYGAWRHFWKASPTGQIERLLDRAAKAAEAESVLRLSDVFTAGYADATGADRAVVLAQANQFFDEAEDIRVSLPKIIHDDPTLPADAETARAVVLLLVEGKMAGGEAFRGIGGGGGDAFELGFTKTGGEWKVSSSRRLAGTTAEELLQELGRE